MKRQTARCPVGKYCLTATLLEIRRTIEHRVNVEFHCREAGFDRPGVYDLEGHDWRVRDPGVRNLGTSGGGLLWRKKR